MELSHLPKCHFPKLLMLAIVIIGVFGLIAIFAPVISPHDPFTWGITNFSLPPIWQQEEIQSSDDIYILGTDRYGRDILSRLLYGTRTAYFLALIAVPLTALFGLVIGLIAGERGGWIDSGLMGISDIFQSLSGIMFAVIIILIFRNNLSPSWFHGMLAIVIGYAGVGWVGLARLVRVNVLQIKTLPYIEAAIAIGAKPSRIIVRHILPNLIHMVLAWMITSFPSVILLEALLGYIGVPITSATNDNDFTVVSWGGLFYSGRSAMNNNPLMIILPSVCILLLSMSFILLADYYKGKFHRQ